VNPRQKREIAVGDADSFERIGKETVGIQAILWNEACIALVTRDPSTVITFRPEINSTVAMFFCRDEKRSERSFSGKEIGVRVWEGDFEPVRFTKSNLLKFLQRYSLKEENKLLESIKNMKVTERHVTTEKMISLEDDDNFRATEEQVLQTNIPTKFSLEVPLIDAADGKLFVSLDFQAQVITSEDRYGEQKGKKLIELRCLNSRQVLHDLMRKYADLLPKSIPRYYGRLAIQMMGESSY
jgi:hypothetical protein